MEAHMTPNWKPSQSDIAWVKNLVDTLNDGSTWLLPVNQSIWKHDKTSRVLRCIHGNRDENFERITAICKLLDYTTEYIPENTTALSADLFGSGKTHSLTSDGTNQYLWRPLTEQDLATIRANITKLPAQPAKHSTAGAGWPVAPATAPSVTVTSKP